MILDFQFRTNQETIRILAPQAGLQIELRNLAGYHTKTKQIVSIGDTADEMQANAPQYWERNGQQISFLHPFSFEETHPDTGSYEPLIAARIVQWAANHAFSRVKRQSFGRLLLSPWVDRVEYTLELDGFERLPVPARREFVKHLKKVLVAVRHVRINGETVIGRR